MKNVVVWIWEWRFVCGRNIAVVGCIERFIGVWCFIGIKTAKGAHIIILFALN